MSERTLRVRIEAADEATLEIALAEAWEAGAAGAEEGADGRSAVAYVPESRADALVAAVASVRGAQARDAEALAEIVWSDAWKEGLGAVVISPRLCVRPPFVATPAGFAGDEIVIEPAQAFGTGHHASTRLALESLDAERTRVAGARVLDVGCGSGVLAIAASLAGARSVVAHDLDPLSGTASGRAVQEHERGASVHVFSGTTEALGTSANGAFDGVVANMIRTELEPLLADFARLVRPGGWCIVSGLLDAERERFGERLTEAGFDTLETRSAADGGDAWLSMVAARG